MVDGVVGTEDVSSDSAAMVEVIANGVSLASCVIGAAVEDSGASSEPNCEAGIALPPAGCT